MLSVLAAVSRWISRLTLVFAAVGLVVEHRLEEDEAHQVARALTYDLVKQAYKL